MIIISGVQGVGKTTLINLLLQKRPILQLSVSSTTRPKRIEEVGGEYDFISLEEFNLKKEQGYFIEDVQVHGHSYGTPKKYFTINRVFNVTASSIENFKKLIGNQFNVSIFITAPLDIVKQRIIGRLDKDCINKKILFAQQELAYQVHFDEVVCNDKAIEQTLEKLLEIVDKYLARVAIL